MPLGLWAGADLPEIPSWYTQDWFHSEFEQFFNLLHFEKIETNRIVFIGSKRSSPVNCQILEQDELQTYTP